MDKILDLSLAYPDFQLNQIIDPDQVDLNNAQVMAKVNEIAKKFNLLVSGSTGASNVTVSPITSFTDKTTVQEVLQAVVDKLVSTDGAAFIGAFRNSTPTTIQEVLNIINTELDNLKDASNNTVTRVSTLEGTTTKHDEKLAQIEQTNINQSSEITSGKQRLLNIESVNSTQDGAISELKTKATFHDQQIATLNSTTTGHSTKVAALETKTSTTTAELSAVKQDIARINTTNTNQEVVDAKVGFATLKDRLLYSEINIGTNVNAKSKLNMIITDSNATDFWEDKVSVASLEEHNVDPTAHGGNITAHNTSSTAHDDIRKLIANKASTWDEIGGKPTLFPSTVHTHTRNQIGDFAHTHVKNEITDFAHNHTKANITDFAHTHAKTEIGLGSIDNVKQMPIAGGTFTGDVAMGTNAKLTGHIVIPTGRPANAVKGTIWLE